MASVEGERVRPIRLFSKVRDRIKWIRRSQGTTQRARRRRAFVESLEPRVLLASDFGDAPDTAAGTGQGNYNTLATDNGPSHTAVAGLMMGATVDMEAGTLQNANANADDVDQALPDDEDGLSNPAVDLTLTQGAQPTVDVIVTNTIGSAATLSGWIDTNFDGVFDNATERAQVAVADGTNGGVVRLTFPAISSGINGQTYARFRLSTDAAAANPTGPAANGEVEDHVVKITARGLPSANSWTKIASSLSGGPTLNDQDYFGDAVSTLGDLDGDGVTDLAVGSPRDNTGGNGRGSVHVLMMNSDATVKSSLKISHQINGGPSLALFESFGNAVGLLDDLDGDGVPELAVGATGDYDNRGAVYVLFMNSNGTVKGSQKIAHQTGGGPPLEEGELFGSSAAALGDLNGDGVGDLAVGAPSPAFAEGEDLRGDLHVLFMNTNGTVKSSLKIAHQTNGGPTLGIRDGFGASAASLGDLDGDGVTELAVGADRDPTGGIYFGSLHVLFMNSDGTVKSSQKISHQTNGGPTLSDYHRFGKAATAVGDLDGDGVTDLAVGARGGTSHSGDTHVLLMNADGTAKSLNTIGNQIGGGPPLNGRDAFGSSATSVGDLDGDGVTDLAVGAGGVDTGGTNRGAVFVLFLAGGNKAPTLDALGSLTINQGASEQTVNLVGISAGSGENQPLRVTAASDNTGLIPDPTVIYSSPQSTGTLTFTPIATSSGVATVTVTVEDGGADNDLNTAADNAKFNRTFGVTVTPTATTVTGVVLNGGSANRSGLADLTFQFSEPTTVDAAGSLILLNHTTGAVVDVSAATLVNNGTNAVTWNLAGIALPDGNYTATLPRAAAGLAATHATSFHVLPGDSGGDSSVGFGDFGELASNFNATGGSAYRPGDMDGDGGVGFGDFGILASNFNRTLPALELDYGDAPESGTSFPTSLANDGARHVIGSLLLGATVDSEADGQPDATASGDGSDEDGVAFGTLTAASNAAVTVTATVPGTAVLNAWIDFNADGDWDDVGEKIISDQPVTNGVNNLSAAIPAGVSAGQVFARFRITTDAGHTYSGLARDGEVEDYQVTLVAARNSASRVAPGLGFQLWAAAIPAVTNNSQKHGDGLESQLEVSPRPVDTKIPLGVDVATVVTPSTEPTLAADRADHETLTDQVFSSEETLVPDELLGTSTFDAR